MSINEKIERHQKTAAKAGEIALAALEVQQRHERLADQLKKLADAARSHASHSTDVGTSTGALKLVKR